MVVDRTPSFILTLTIAVAEKKSCTGVTGDAELI